MDDCSLPNSEAKAGLRNTASGTNNSQPITAPAKRIADTRHADDIADTDQRRRGRRVESSDAAGVLELLPQDLDVDLPKVKNFCVLPWTN